MCHRSKFINNDCIYVLKLKIVFSLANNANPDKRLQYEAIHPELYCLLKYLFTSIKNDKG